MASIKEIVSHLESELQQLIKPYKDQIDQLKKENEKLTSDFTSVKNENRNLHELLSMNEAKENKIENEFLLDHLKELSPVVSLDMIDELFLSSSVDDSFLLLFHCDNFLKLGQLDKVHYIIDLLFHNPQPLLHNDKRIHGLFLHVFNQLIEVSRNDKDAFEGMMEALLKLVSVLHDTLFKDQMEISLKDHYSDLLEAALYINEAKLVIDTLKLMMKYNLQAELKEALRYMIETEWGFLDYHLSKDEFCFFLWYSFLFDLDQALLDQTKESTKWLNVQYSTLQLYPFLYDCIEQQRIVDQLQLDNIFRSFQKTDVFTEKEIEMILAQVKEDLNAFSNQATSTPKQVNPQYRGRLQMFQAEVLDRVVAYNKLTLKPMMVPLYQGRSNLISRTIDLEIYMTEDMNRGFIADELVDEIERRYYPDQLNVVKYDIIKHTKPERTPNKPPKKESKPEPSTLTSFHWPNTEIQEHPSTEVHEDQPILNENSDLKKMGYQITGLTSAKRWDILQKAVPSLGLKKVAYTIAYNVRLRKGQKNGRKKYQYAIGEWENDLEKLKKTYYIKDFTWPNF